LRRPLRRQRRGRRVARIHRRRAAPKRRCALPSAPGAAGPRPRPALVPGAWSVGAILTGSAAILRHQGRFRPLSRASDPR
jgi:hypothetical protein